MSPRFSGSANFLLQACDAAALEDPPPLLVFPEPDEPEDPEVPEEELDDVEAAGAAVSVFFSVDAGLALSLLASGFFAELYRSEYQPPPFS